MKIFPAWTSKTLEAMVMRSIATTALLAIVFMLGMVASCLIGASGTQVSEAKPERDNGAAKDVTVRDLSKCEALLNECKKHCAGTSKDFDALDK
jgi:hypothetical protein